MSLRFVAVARRFAPSALTMEKSIWPARSAAMRVSSVGANFTFSVSMYGTPFSQ